MIIEFNVRNFRSLKDTAMLSFEANTSKQKSENLHKAQYASNRESHTLIRSVAILGYNASGKSNVLKAFAALQFLVLSSREKNGIGDSFACYEPFLLDKQYASAPVELELLFIVNSKKYRFVVKYSRDQIEEERLSFFKTKSESTLYTRQANNSDIHNVKFGRELRAEGVKKEVLKNQLFLSKFNKEAHTVLTEICGFFKNIDIEMSVNGLFTRVTNESIAKEILNSNNTSNLKEKLERLIKTADIPINEIFIGERDDSEFNFPSDFPVEFKNQIISEHKMKIGFSHNTYDNDVKVEDTIIPLEEQSMGTQVLFGLGARVLKALERGSILVYDEFDNSMHPYLSRLLVALFNNDSTNANNAQLIINTHETSIIERDMLRSDQIWLAEKNQYGATELFSLQDFEGIREDIPFDKWYKSGKFGAIPSFGNIDYIFSTPDETAK